MFDDTNDTELLMKLMIIYSHFDNGFYTGNTCMKQ